MLIQSGWAVTPQKQDASEKQQPAPSEVFSSPANEGHRHFSLLTARPPGQKFERTRHVGAPSTARIQKLAPRPKGGVLGRSGRAAAKTKRG